MQPDCIDLGPLRKAIATLFEAIAFLRGQAKGSPLKPYLRSAVLQSFEISTSWRRSP